MGIALNCMCYTNDANDKYDTNQIKNHEKHTKCETNSETKRNKNHERTAHIVLFTVWLSSKDWAQARNQNLSREHHILLVVCVVYW